MEYRLDARVVRAARVVEAGEDLAELVGPAGHRADDPDLLLATARHELLDELKRADTIVFGLPLYNYGAVVDDITMKVNLVGRGDDDTLFALAAGSVQFGTARFLFMSRSIHLIVRATEQPMSSIDIDLISGDMKHYESRWELVPVPETGGTKVLSDWIEVKITSNPGETFLDRMIALVEGAKRQKTSWNTL